MKKLLGFFLALAVSLGCMVALAACNKGNSAENEKTAEAVITQLNIKYGSESAQTTHSYDYTVVGKVAASGKSYDITWSVSSDYSDYKNHVSVSSKMNDDNMYTIIINPATEAFDYVLKASVTVGKVTKSSSFNRTVAAYVSPGSGTFDDPFSVSKVFQIAETLGNQKFYDGTTPGGVAAASAVRFYVKGYVVDPGKTTDQGGNYGGGVQYVYIVDEYAEDMNSYSDGALSVASLKYNDHLSADNLLTKGEQIIVSGYIENYNNKPSIYFITGQNIFCEWRSSEGEKTPDEKVDSALNNIKITDTFTTKQTYNLPTSDVTTGTAFNWAVKTAGQDLVSINNNVLSIDKIPTEETSIELTVTATLEGATTKTKDITIKVIPAAVTEHAGTAEDPYSLADVKAIFATLASGKTYQENGVDKQVYIKGYVTDAGAINGTYGLKNTYIADVAGTPKEESVLIYNINWGGALTNNGVNPLHVGDEIVVYGFIMNHIEGGYEIGQSGSGSSATYPTVTTWNPRTLSDEEKANDALAVVNIPENLYEDYTIPAREGITYSISSNNNDAILIDGNTLKITRGATDVEVKITVTATSGSYTTPTAKEFTVVVKAAEKQGNYTLTVDSLGISGVAYANGNGTKTINGIEFQYAAIGDYGNGIQMRTNSDTGTSTLWNNTAFTDGITKVVFTWNKSQTTKSDVLKVELADNAAFTNAKVEKISSVKDSSTELTVIGAYTYIRITHNNNGATYIDELTISCAPISDDDIALAAKEDVKLEEDQFNEVGEYDLPQSHPNGATYTWSVKDAEQNYVSITEDNKLKIEALPEEETDITLVVTVNYGTATPLTKEIDITLLPAGTEIESPYGSLANPLSVTEALEIIKSLSSDGYTDEHAFVVGYVVDLGGWNTQFSNFTNVYIADSFKSNNGSADALQLFRLYPDGESVKVQGDLKLGAKIIAEGYLQNYKGNTPEMTYQGSDNPYIVSYTEPADDAKVYFALKSVPATKTVSEAGNIDLPESTVDGVTFTWSNNSANASTYPVEGGKLVISALPADDEETTLTVTAACGEVSTDNTKTMVVTIKKATTGDEPGSVCLAAFTLGADKDTTTHNDGTSKANAKSAYTETVNNHTLTVDGGPQFYINANDAKGKVGFKLGSSSAAGSFTFTVGDDVKQVIIYVATYKTSTNKAYVSVNGGASVTINDLKTEDGKSYASNDGLYYGLVIDTTTTKEITFATVSGGTRCMVDSIEFWS